jgi:hypothetical protein
VRRQQHRVDQIGRPLLKETYRWCPQNIQPKNLGISSIFGETCPEDATTWRILMTFCAAAPLTGLQEPPQLKNHSKKSVQDQRILQEDQDVKTSPDNCKEFVRGKGQTPKRQATFRSSSKFI